MAVRATVGIPKRVTGKPHPGGGLPLVALSAEIVAGLVGPA